MNSNGIEDEIITVVLDKLFQIKNKLVLKDIFTRVLRQEIYNKNKALESVDFESESTEKEYDEPDKREYVIA